MRPPRSGEIVTVILEGIPKIVILALANDLESVTEVAVSVTLGGFGALDGAV